MSFSVLVNGTKEQNMVPESIYFKLNFLYESLSKMFFNHLLEIKKSQNMYKDVKCIDSLIFYCPMNKKMVSPKFKWCIRIFHDTICQYYM